MSSRETQELIAADLPIALYLNQRDTFDLLAALEGGFSQFSTVQTTSTGKTSADVSGEAQLGSSNVFAFLGVKLGGRAARKVAQDQSESTTGEIVHTPASLFARLRKDLSDRSLLRHVSGETNLDDIHPGDFVEFEATLRKSPVIELLLSFSELMPLIGKFQEQPAAKGPGRGGRTNQSEVGKIRGQIDALLSVLTADGSQDVIAELGSTRAVLTTEQNFFVDPTMNDLIDGTFRVLGKATRIVPGGSPDKISLMRKSPLGKFGTIMQGLTAAMATLAEGEEVNYTASVETEIHGPALQVIPIAIFS